MIINLSKIPETGLEIDADVTLSKELYKNADILDLQNVHIMGNVKYDYENHLVLELQVKGEFQLEDAITLEPIVYPFTCEVEEKLENISEYCGKFYEKSKNTLDISEILWENIVLEIPISATNSSSEDLTLQGEGWELVNENKKKIDPRLEKLTELFKDGKE